MSTLIAVGNVGRDGELRTLQDGTKVLSFSIADSIGYGDKKRTQWLGCALFGKRAESLAQYITKGSLVEVVGTPSIHTYESKGEHRAEIQVRVMELTLRGGGKRDSEEPVADRGRATRGNDMDQDIPF